MLGSIACGTGNTAITAKLMTDAKVTGVDFTPELLAIAKEEASIAEADDNKSILVSYFLKILPLDSDSIFSFPALSISSAVTNGSFFPPL